MRACPVRNRSEALKAPSAHASNEENRGKRMFAFWVIEINCNILAAVPYNRHKQTQRQMCERLCVRDCCRQKKIHWYRMSASTELLSTTGTMGLKTGAKSIRRRRRRTYIICVHRSVAGRIMQATTINDGRCVTFELRHRMQSSAVS